MADAAKDFASDICRMSKLGMTGSNMIQSFYGRCDRCARRSRRAAAEAEPMTVKAKAAIAEILVSHSEPLIVL